MVLILYFIRIIPTNFEKREESKILQFHVELLQALLLQNSYSDSNEIMPIIPSNIYEVERLLLNVTESYQFRKFKDFAEYEDETEKMKMLYVDRMRNNTLAVRNWAYPEQIVRITKGVFSKMDEDIKCEIGISAVALIDMFKKIVIKIEDKHNLHMQKVRKFYKCNDKLQMIKIYKENWPEVKTSEEDFLKISRKFSSRNDFKNSLLFHSDMFIRDIFTLDIEDYKNAYSEEIDSQILSKVLDSFSHSYGDLAENNAEYFFLGNPIWCKPFVKVDDTHFVLPIPGLLFHSCFDMIELLLSNYPKLKEKYERCRAEYLEESIEREFRKGFPDAQILRGVIWHDDTDGKKYESDLLILLDSYAIAIEAKSGKITNPSRRGAPERLKKDIEKLIVEPSIQACRFSRYLDRHSGQKITIYDKSDNEIILDLTQMRASLTFSITLDLFGSLGTNLVELYNAGFIRDKDDLSPCMTIADLEIITDLLITSCEKIHYFSRRYEMEKHAKFIADELDLLVFYLETGFNIGESEYDGLELNLYGISSKLDSYYLNEYHNPSEIRIKPQSRKTKWWSDIVKKLEEQKIPRWTEFSYALLNVSFEDQQQFEIMFKKVVETVEKEFLKENHKNSVVLYNSFKRNDAIIVLVYKGIGKELRNTRIENIAAKAFKDEERCKRALILGVSLDDMIYPYNVLAVIDKKL